MALWEAVAGDTVGLVAGRWMVTLIGVGGGIRQVAAIGEGSHHRYQQQGVCQQ